MNRAEIYNYYSREDVMNAIFDLSNNREIAGALRDGSYTKRPSVLQYPNDIIKMVIDGVTSFHFSVEHWQYPMIVGTPNYEQTRIGWDIIIDIDSKIGIDVAKNVVEIVLKFIKKFGVKNVGIKFSGSRGFHLIIPWVALPKQYGKKEMKYLYPKALHNIISYIKSNIEDDVRRSIMNYKEVKEVIEDANFDPYFFVEIEENWGPRHMFRAPYSLNEKTWLSSVVVKNIRSFDVNTAKPECVEVRDFLPDAEPLEAMNLVQSAMDYYASLSEEEQKEEIKNKIDIRRIDEILFPPCIKNILNGLNDGRKRSLFILINFLKMAKWNWNEIEKQIKNWNKNNKPPLRDSIVKGQLNYNKNKPFVPPPNCGHELYYKSIGICKPDEVCKTIKNPVGYILKKYSMQKKREYECSVCGRKFKTLKSLRHHLSRKHGLYDIV